MSITQKRKDKSAECVAMRMLRALQEEERRILELEDEYVTTFKALQRVEEMLNEILPKGGTAHSEHRERVIASTQRLRRLIDMRSAELANMWLPRVESMILDVTELRLLISEQDSETP